MALKKHGFKTNLVSFWRPNRRERREEEKREEEEEEEKKKRREKEGEKFKQAKRYGTMTLSKDSSKIWYESLVLYGYYLAQT